MTDKNEKYRATVKAKFSPSRDCMSDENAIANIIISNYDYEEDHDPIGDCLLIAFNNTMFGPIQELTGGFLGIALLISLIPPVDFLVPITYAMFLPTILWICCGSIITHFIEYTDYLKLRVYDYDGNKTRVDNPREFKPWRDFLIFRKYYRKGETKKLYCSGKVNVFKSMIYSKHGERGYGMGTYRCFWSWFLTLELIFSLCISAGWAYCYYKMACKVFAD